MVALLARTTGGDLQLAEDALQLAVVAALEQWDRGMPDRPVGWLVRTARFKAIDQMRRQGVWARKADALAAEVPTMSPAPELPDEAIPDERLRLMCTCCHPALSLEAQVALTLKTVSGLTSEEVARAFLVDRTTMQQRIVRAKQKIRVAGIPYEVPAAEALGGRLAGILRVIYLVFTEGWAATDGEDLVRGALCDEAIRLGELLVAQVDGDSEVHGLLSLMLFTDARRQARVDAQGLPVLLADQDRLRWDRRRVGLGFAALAAATRRGPPGPYTLQAAIASVHMRATRADDTAWDEVVALYDLLLQADPSPVVALNRAAALAMRDGPEAGLAAMAPLLEDPHLARGHLLAASRARLLGQAGRPGEAVLAYEDALTRVTHPAERAWLTQQRDRWAAGVGEA